MNNKLIYIITLVIFLFSCSKKKCSRSRFDISEDQTNWTKIPYVSIDNSQSDFRNVMINDIFFIDDEIGYIIGSVAYHENASRIYKTTDGGNSWDNNYAYGCGAGSVGKSIFFSTPTTGFATFTCLGFGFAETHDGGNSWVKNFNVSTMDVGAQNYVIDSLSMIVGNLKTTDGGVSWQIINPPATTTSYYFMDTNYGVCATNNGVIAETHDFGITWDTIYYNDANNFNSVVMTDANTIIAGGKNIVKSNDRGDSWFYTYTNGVVNDIKFVDSNIGFSALSDDYGYEPGKILKTIDGGDSWFVNYESVFIGFTSLEIINSNTIICCGRQGECDGKIDQGYIVRTTTQGN